MDGHVTNLYQDSSFYDDLYLKQSKPKTIYLNEEAEGKSLSWFQKIIKAIVDFFKRVFNLQ
jgi:hypothetical protein